MNGFILCLLTLVTLSTCLQLPSSFKKCNRKRTDFNKCLSKAIYHAIRILDKSIKSHGLPSLYHVEYPPDVLVEVGNSTYGLRQKISKLKFTGLSNPDGVAAWMEFGSVSSTLTIEATYSEILFEAEWEGQGTIVLLPINFITPTELILYDPIFSFTFELEEYEKGTTHYRVISAGIDVQVRSINFDFKHIFASERLNYEFNSAMTEKSSQIFTQCKHLQGVFAPLFGTMFNHFLEKVPVAELFYE